MKNCLTIFFFIWFKICLFSCFTCLTMLFINCMFRFLSKLFAICQSFFFFQYWLSIDWLIRIFCLFVCFFFINEKSNDFIQQERVSEWMKEWKCVLKNWIELKWIWYIFYGLVDWLINWLINRLSSFLFVCRE